MAERKIPHVEDVFKRPVGKHNGEKSNSGAEYFDFNFKAFKNKQAPQPPGGPVSLPRIGNYQPKILMESQTPDSDIQQHTRDKDTIKEINEKKNNIVQKEKKVVKEQIIMGDKDIPITINDGSDDQDIDAPYPQPRRKRRAPEVPEHSTDVIPRSDAQTTNNPLFGRSISVASDEEPFDMDVEIQGGDIDFGPGIDNPGFQGVNSGSQYSSITEHRENSLERRTEVHTATQSDNKNSNQYPYIPPPDYDDEEVTMTFEDEERDEFEVNHQHGRVFKEFEGEDFARYLRDEEDYEFDRPQPVRHMKGRAPPRPHAHDNRFHKKPEKPKKKSKRKEPDMKRNTIRDFTFSDSKIGWGDRTVKSTSAKGRYIKREKDRKRIDTNFDKHEKSDRGSYEEFLRIRNGMGPPAESPNSSDSGVEVEIKNRENFYYHSQPKQMKNGKYDKKPSVWQKLTWRFKKGLNISRIDQT